MSTPFTTASPAAAVPPTREFTAAWIAYLLYTVSSFLLWPALIALFISYNKRAHAETGFIGSHHRWMLRSFWYSQLWFLVGFALVMVGIWPLLSDIIHQAIATAEAGGDPTFSIDINWSSVFTSVGGAMMGGIAIAVTWFWFLYRMIRGMVALADARPLP